MAKREGRAAAAVVAAVVFRKAWRRMTVSSGRFMLGGVQRVVGSGREMAGAKKIATKPTLWTHAKEEDQKT
jgi:hypothetical protein